mmetsp:Transcript_10760/g.39521  ORF Transcript_10760/g.39521 Transcript_10760/m.39521 type:complete len:404 (-) Transcript_10760:1736-2947(-)
MWIPSPKRIPATSALLSATSVKELPAAGSLGKAIEDDSSAVLVVGVVLSWFVCNVGVMSTNKYIMPKFPHPITLTSIHMLACSFLSMVSIEGLGLFTLEQLKSPKFGFKVFLLAATFAASLTLGNFAFTSLSLAFIEIVSSSCPFFVAVLAFVLQGLIESPYTYAALIPTIGGAWIASVGELNFVVIGFIAVLSATVLRALKAVLAAILLTGETEKLSSPNLLKYTTSFAALLLVPIAISAEPGSLKVLAERLVSQEGQTFAAVFTANIMFAYGTNIFNYLVTFHTSAVTLNVLGLVKQAFCVMISVFVFDSQISLTQLLGYSILLCGVVLFSYMKRQQPARLTAWAERRKQNAELQAKEFGETPSASSGFAHFPTLITSMYFAVASIFPVFLLACLLHKLGL